MDLTRNLPAEAAVMNRYARASQEPEPALCCAVQYDARLLAVIPQEVIEKDYGCGDPSRYIHEGETVLDLGSGTGKICFIAAQIVGARGKVIGIDMTDEMLAVARRNAPIVSGRIGYSNVEFRKGRIQDLRLDLDLFEQQLNGWEIRDAASYLMAEDLAGELRDSNPLVPSASIDVVVSNCVLNLVAPAAKKKLFFELYRVLRKEGRAVISDIVADRPVPSELQADPELWSGCISGALTETQFTQAFERAGFKQIKILSRQSEPWRVVHGIEFRSVTVEASKVTVKPSLPALPETQPCCSVEKCC